MDLNRYVIEHARRGDCVCGKCADAARDPKQPNGHTVDLVFFRVALAGEPNPEELKELIRKHEGCFKNVDPFDGKEHSYIELGAWLGDQGTALMLMGIGALIGIWVLLTPETVLGLRSDDPLTMQLAGRGMITVKADKESL